MENFLVVLHIVGFIITLAVCLILAPILIPILTRLKFGQTVRDDGPKSHLIKTGTPTMGGVLFVIPVFILSLVFTPAAKDILPLAFAMLGFGFVGFLDDFLKIIKKSKDGLFAGQKLFGLILVSVLFGMYLFYFTDINKDFNVPILGFDLTFGSMWIYFIYVVVVLLSTTNSVNMTDGLDGLAAGVTLIVMVFFSLFAILKGNMDGVKIFATLCSAGCLGFLAFNLHPAKLFMGDTGSLALGGAVGALALMSKLPPLILVIICGVYAMESLSVIIQVASFKLRKKRVFKMAPIHHHFELVGWDEIKVVRVFWSITFILCLLGGCMAYFGVF